MTWRDKIAVHPDAEMFPMETDAEIKELAEDIKKNGLLYGVTIWTDGHDKRWLVDGRRRISDLLGRVSKPSSVEIDNLIGDFEGLRRRLQTDRDRIQREIEEYHALSQQVMVQARANLRQSRVQSLFKSD